MAVDSFTRLARCTIVNRGACQCLLGRTLRSFPPSVELSTSPVILLLQIPRSTHHLGDNSHRYIDLQVNLHDCHERCNNHNRCGGRRDDDDRS